jgi:hypothetical protein
MLYVSECNGGIGHGPTTPHLFGRPTIDYVSPPELVQHLHTVLSTVSDPRLLECMLIPCTGPHFEVQGMSLGTTPDAALAALGYVLYDSE